MKNLSFLAVAGLMIGNIASAVVMPGWERPIMGAELTYISPTKPVSGLRANYLTLNQRDGAKNPTSLTCKKTRESAASRLLPEQQRHPVQNHGDVAVVSRR